MAKRREKREALRHIQTLSDARAVKDITTRPATEMDVKYLALPARTIRIVKGSGLVRGIRDIQRIGKREWEPEVARSRHVRAQQELDKRSAIYQAMDRIQAAMAQVEEERRKTQKFSEELQASNEEMQATNEEMEASNEELQSTQEELRGASTYARSLIEANLDSLVTISPQGKITDVNETTVKVTGVPREKLIGTDFADYFTKPEKARAGYKRVIKKGLVRDYPLELRQKKGGAIPVLYNASVYRDEKGKLVGVFAAARDITELKRTEEKIQAANEELQAGNEEMQATNEELRATAEELERTNEQMQQFASVASHELQEPLRMVASYLELIEKRYKSRLDKKGREFMAFAVDGAQRMQRLVNDLLTYSRVTTRGKSFSPANCEDILKQVLNDMQVTIKKARAKVTHGRLPQVTADSEQLAQLFQNLINNAIKFRKQKQRPLVDIRVEKKKSEWVFSVQDNGIGIAPEHQERIFQIFQRLHGKKEYPGTGIGLALCQNIVQRHGGRIWIKSKPGKGAVFNFTLPMRKAAEAERMSKRVNGEKSK